MVNQHAKSYNIFPLVKYIFRIKDILGVEVYNRRALKAARPKNKEIDFGAGQKLPAPWTKYTVYNIL